MPVNGNPFSDASARCPLYPQKQTFIERCRHVRFVPKADIIGRKADGATLATRVLCGECPSVSSLEVLTALARSRDVNRAKLEVGH